MAIMSVEVLNLMYHNFRLYNLPEVFHLGNALACGKLMLPIRSIYVMPSPLMGWLSDSDNYPKV